VAHRNFARAMRRKTQWGGYGDSAGAANLNIFVGLAAGTPAIISSSIVVSGALGLVDEEVTITRMIGNVSATMNVGTSGASAMLAIGCVVVRNESIAAGVASLPSPEDDPDAEWLYYLQVALRNPTNALSDGPISGAIVPHDVRGQRILRAGSNVVWVAESQTADVAVTVGGRYLVKLT